MGFAKTEPLGVSERILICTENPETEPLGVSERIFNPANEISATGHSRKANPGKS